MPTTSRDLVTRFAASCDPKLLAWGRVRVRYVRTTTSARLFTSLESSYSLFFFFCSLGGMEKWNLFDEISKSPVRACEYV
jgi:hypothetical protein